MTLMAAPPAVLNKLMPELVLPDTLLFTTDGTFLLNPIYYKSLPYSMNDLTPVSLIATALFVSNVYFYVTEDYFGRGAAWQQKSSSDFDAFVNEGRFEELAIAEYDKVLQLAPKSAGALGNRGQLYHTLRKYDLAIADFTQAIEISPANPMFLRSRALTYRMMRRVDLAIADYRSALALTQDADGRKVIGELLAQLGVTV